MALEISWLKTSQARNQQVIKDIEAGSEPRSTFYIMLIAASLIASLGLVANSTAVIIGAMLVSPLMTPIFGIALAMLLGDTRLFWRAGAAETLGVVLAVGVAFLFGLAPLELEPTNEMLIRISPNLLDLLVAVFAGAAGAFALIDERVSPALPGVAMATAIVPPLSNTGLCLALGAYEGAIGSFLLFVANFFAILVVGAGIFYAAGISKTPRDKGGQMVKRNLIFAAGGFLLVALFLTQALVTMVQERRTERLIRTVVAEKLSQLKLPAISLSGIDHHERRDRMQVLARIRSPKIVTAGEVRVLQEALSDALERPVEMVVRTVVSRDVAAAGSIVQAARPDLDGLLVTPNLSSLDRKERLAEQLIIEKLGDEPGFELGSVDYAEAANYPVIVVSLQMMAPIDPGQVQELRDFLRERFEDPKLELVVRHDRALAISSHETFLTEWTSYYNFDETDFELFAEVRQLVMKEVERQPDLFCTGVHLNEYGGKWRILAEVAGPHPPTPAQVKAIRRDVAERTPQPVELSLWFRANTVVTDKGHLSYEEFTREAKERRMERLRTRTRKGLNPSESKQ